jgi:hypothetical protein
MVIMAHQLTFHNLLLYDPGKEGISLEVQLKLENKTVAFEAKIDTGASYCIFQRRIGESLGIDIEQGVRIQVGTVTDSFIAFGSAKQIVLMKRPG